MRDPGLDHSEVAVLCRSCGATSIGVPGASCGACVSLDSALVARSLQPAFEENALLGRVLEGKYAIVGVLGRGGFGAVYRALQRPVGRPVAVKVMLGKHAENPDVRARFFREARAAAHLTHPSIVTLHDYGEAADGLLFMVLELVAGENLARLLRRERPLEPARAVALMGQVLSALVVAHAHGIVHRDLKPYNLMVTRSFDGEQVKVLDFGMAKVLRNDGRAGPSDASDELLPAETRQGMVIGSPTYMSPEQARAEEATPASDLYAVGVVLWEMLVGQVPFTTRNPQHPVDLLLKHINDPPPPMPAHLGIPPALEAVVRQAMAKRPEDRFADARAMAEALRAAVRSPDGSKALSAPGWTSSGPLPGASNGAPEGAPESVPSALSAPPASGAGLRSPAHAVSIQTTPDGRPPRATSPPGEDRAGDGAPVEAMPTIATPSSFSVDWLDSAMTELSPASRSRESLFEARGELGEAPTPARSSARWLMPALMATAVAAGGSLGAFAVLSSDAPEGPLVGLGAEVVGAAAGARSAAASAVAVGTPIVARPAGPEVVPRSANLKPAPAPAGPAAAERTPSQASPSAAPEEPAPAEQAWGAALAAATQGDGPQAVRLLTVALEASPAAARAGLVARAKAAQAMQYTARRHPPLARLLGLPVRPVSGAPGPEPDVGTTRPRTPATRPSTATPPVAPRIERK